MWLVDVNGKVVGKRKVGISSLSEKCVIQAGVKKKRAKGTSKSCAGKQSPFRE